ncbi:MAG: hypothetical protein JAY74_03510 [Candidatus Thiodiazotropha taylori]|nr:hypothetical protein [Candidatus Thiodiazotropha taylori]
MQNTCEALGLSGIGVKLSLSTMYAENRVIDSQKVKGLTVRGFNNSLRISLPDTFTRSIMPANRSHIPTPEMARMWPHLETISENLMPLSQCEIGLLIGYNCPQALLPREVIPPVGNGPFGQRTDLGWGIVGIIEPRLDENDTIGVSHRVIALEVPSSLSTVEQSYSNHVLFSLKTTVKEVVGTDVLRIMEHEFCDPVTNVTTYSQEDQRFLNLLDQGISFQDGHYEMPLPFRKENPILPNNKSIAISRLQFLKTRFKKDGKFCRDYFEFMSNLIKNGHAERVSNAEKFSGAGQTWYIPHHGVYHPQKPDKIRVVFDCSSVYNGESLNSHLLQGPDLTNKLLGVICRFRKESIAIMCDVEQMFYQFKVNKEHRDYLRFLWWDGDDYSAEPVEFRMTVHLFGATSSPGCANFGLKRIASDNETEYGKEVANFLRHDFYVDDGLKSLATVNDALKLIDKSKAMCSKGGVRLHKFVSNNREVIEFLDPEDRAKDLKDIDIISDRLPIERALGVSWCIQSDTFQFRINLNNRPLTRRGILSIVSSLYDPLGFIAPVVLAGKRILQQMCADRADWDDPLPEPLRERWEQWRTSLDSLRSLRIHRCVKPDGFGHVKSVQLHHFSDASTYGYGQCSYLRLVNQDGQVACSFIMGKARVVPLRPMTIPRLELAAALMSVRIAAFLDQELDYENITHTYWTDSKVVLGYIANECKRFHVYVANRVQQIREHTNFTQWSYVTSAENPADIASRGLCANELATNSTWLKGPDFLWKSDVSVTVPEGIDIEHDDPELKRGQSFAVSAKLATGSMLERLKYFSDWHRAKRAVALCLMFKRKLLQHSVKRPKTSFIPDLSQYQPVSVDELRKAEFEIIKIVQADQFQSELSTLKTHKIFGAPSDRNDVSNRHKALKSKSELRSLDPFIDSEGIIRVGGRIQNAMVPNDLKHPVVLPKRGHVIDLVIRYFHEKALHQGRGITISEIRNSGYWLINCSSNVANAISKCVICRRLRSPVQEQKMASLPNDRLEYTPPFTYCAVDCFGPFYIKEGRKELKRYGVLFTCMACRAVHVETVNTMETDSFINCLRRFISIRGPLRQLRCDRGSNFVGAENELSKALSELDEERLQQFLLRENCDLFGFKMNVPAASHMGGAWERQIRSIRNVLCSLLLNHGEQLNDESLRTFLYESAAIVNSRPLSVDNINDPLSITPLTPNQLLTMKTKIILPPPGNFQKTSLYCRKYWRRTQYLVNEFWMRWRDEFLQNLQARRKWVSPKRNLAVGDIVLLKDDNQSRNLWQLARVTETFASDDGLIRKVKIVMAVSDLDKAGKRKGELTYLERPIHKLVLLKETEEIPDKEP